MEPNDHENELKLIIDRPDADGELQVFLEPSATVLELKQAIETMDHHLQVGLQRLVWNGRQLADREVLQNVFRNTTDVPNLKLLLRKYAYSPTPMKRAHSAPTPTPSHQPSAPPEAPAAPPHP